MDHATEERLVTALERVADANEALIDLAKEERDSGESIFGPPFCPHCGTFSPSVRNEGGSGSMNEFVLAAACENCGKQFFAIPQGWWVFKTAPEAKQAMEERAT